MSIKNKSGNPQFNLGNIFALSSVRYPLPILWSWISVSILWNQLLASRPHSFLACYFVYPIAILIYLWACTTKPAPVKPKRCPSYVSAILILYIALALLPETRAQCVSIARRDLSGGCEVTRIPTATFPLFPYFPKIFINSYPSLNSLPNISREMFSDPLNQ